MAVSDRTLAGGNFWSRCKPTWGSVVLLLAFCWLGQSGCSSRNKTSHVTASPRLHMVAVLYGKFASAHGGQLPTDEQEFVAYVDANEREVLQRYGLRSSQDIFTESADRPRLVVLYRDPRERLKSNFVAIEQRTTKDPKSKTSANGALAGGDTWVAADLLGVGCEISADTANRILAEATQTAEKSPAKTEPDTEQESHADKNRQSSRPKSQATSRSIAHATRREAK
jgi:hypothetical protein